MGKAKAMGINWQLLRDPFPAEDVRWRIQQSGSASGKPWAQVMAYLTNRAIQARLDEVIGPDRWCNHFREGPGGGVICGISILVDNGEWVEKWDGADSTDVEAVKGGLSDAMKRAAVQWGIGRYLYGLGVGFAQVCAKGTPGSKNARLKDGTWFSWLPPQLPSWALPPERPDVKWINSMCDPAVGFTLDQILKLVDVVRGDTSVSAITRETAIGRLREMYRAKRGTDDAGGTGGAGPADAGSTEGLLPQPAAGAAVEGQDVRGTGGSGDQAV